MEKWETHRVRRLLRFVRVRLPLVKRAVPATTIILPSRRIRRRIPDIITTIVIVLRWTSSRSSHHKAEKMQSWRRYSLKVKFTPAVDDGKKNPIILHSHHKKTRWGWQWRGTVPKNKTKKATREEESRKNFKCRRRISRRHTPHPFLPRHLY